MSQALGFQKLKPDPVAPLLFLLPSDPDRALKGFLYKRCHVSLHSREALRHRYNQKGFHLCEIYEASYSEHMYLTVPALPGHVAKSFYLHKKQNKQ